ncbi:saccharopine dehydrogenase family protein [Litoribrevibacter albus]|uniref:Saccharopine dehydrogenase n=1 Tax=Litoribrevibacter albus TaxID=1473156 RepID=A0AA37SB61_9GAMM|nr:saccharopine dehydrogenase NADP-binding domain-containing protein [Litoribrevibacter albus]GLQ31951.1 saccharopine dehydrogenase [Litoribrevibacter albus]
MSAQTYDLIVFGATSFVGEILTHYLNDTFNGPDQESLNWAIAGRSKSKLESLKSSLGNKASELAIVVADAADQDQLHQLCQQTRTVVSTVGPYALYGEPLVKVCCETGTDYCDLTGEVQWINRMIRKYEAKAKETGARIVHCCGFDSIPSDMGVYFLQQQAEATLGSTCNNIKMRVKAAKGGASGGTVASMVNITKEATANPQLRKELANPYSICPEGHPFKTRQHNVNSAEFDNDFNKWSAPFVMAAINTRVVHRSNGLLDAKYGENLKYDEAMLVGNGLKGRLMANAIVAGLAGFLVGAALPPTRWLLERFVLPKPGEGPSPEEQVNGYFDLRFVGKNDNGQEIKVKVTGQGDPGYGSTSKMLGQAAACLSLDISKEDKAGGFWTPSTILGDKLLTRLTEKSDMTFEVI